MLSKMDTRRIIENEKEKYNKTNNKDILIRVAILKGYYLVIGGTKAIPLPNKFDLITANSKLIFKYKMKISNHKSIISDIKATEILYKLLLINNKQPEYYINSQVYRTNTDLANLLTRLICSEYTEDILINQQTVFNIALNTLNDVTRKE